MKFRELVIVPAFNEDRTIAKVISDLRQFGFSEIVVVDDGSSDDTSKIAQKSGAKVLSHPINCGVGSATQTGILWGIEHGFDHFLTIDADCQQFATDLRRIANSLDKHDCVIGSRFLKKNRIPTLRRIANRIANWTTGVFFGVWVSDSQSGLRGFTQKVANRLSLHGGRFEYCSEFCREVDTAGFSIHEIPISVEYSKDSMKKGQNFAEGIATFAKLFFRAISR